jgi:hypothetical protein
VRFTGDELFVFPADGFDSCRAFAHRAFCASAIRLRAATDVTRPGLTPLRKALEPFRPTSLRLPKSPTVTSPPVVLLACVLLPKLLECTA